MIGLGQETMEGPHKQHQVGDRKERIIGQNTGHEIPLEIEDVLDTHKKTLTFHNNS